MQTIVRLQRLSHKLFNSRALLLARTIHVLIRIIYSADIHFGAKIDPSVKFAHKGLGVVIGHEAVIEKNVVILNNVTIGGRGNHVSKTGRHNAIIGESTIIGCNTCILGGVIIGANVQIGGGTVVVDDIPDGSVVYSSKGTVKSK